MRKNAKQKLELRRFKFGSSCFSRVKKNPPMPFFFFLGFERFNESMSKLIRSNTVNYPIKKYTVNYMNLKKKFNIIWSGL